MALSTAISEVLKLSESDRVELIQQTFDQLPEEDQKAVAEEVGKVLPGTSQATRDLLWKIVVGASACVLIRSFFTLAISLFVPPDPGGTQAQMILTIFTAAVGFLAGLFAPSPAAN